MRGISPLAHVSIFLRELRDVWEKADPKPTPLVILAANKLGMIKGEDPEKALGELKEFWRRNEVPGDTFVNFETALLRLGKGLCRKGKCRRCVLQPYCSAAMSA